MENQKKKKEKKGLFVKARKHMGWHVGRGLLLCLTHRAGVPALCVSVPAVWVQFAEPQAYDILYRFPPSPLKVLGCVHQAVPYPPQAKSLAA